MRILLYYTNENIIKEYIGDDILYELYYKLAIIPNNDLLKKYINNNKIKFNEYIDKNNNKLDENINEYIKKLKKIISEKDNNLPLYDAQTKNIYLIMKQNVYYRVVNSNYRIVNNEIANILINIKESIKEIKNKNKFLMEYYEKLIKNINFIQNYDYNILNITYNKVLHDTNPVLNELTTCQKSYYLPYQKINPYYTKLEIMKLKIIFNIDDDNNICEKLKTLEIDAKTLLNHQLYLNINKAKSYVQFYSLLGSFLFNNYLRDKDSEKDIILEKHILNFYNIINKAPSFDKSIILYRYIDNDQYLSHLDINDIYNEYSFISTTRDPFYAINKNLFGFILLKINIPKNIEGIGICLESYSLFEEELEILLSPGSFKLKKIYDIRKLDDKNEYIYNKNDLNDYIYLDKNIVKIYEFDYIKNININEYIETYNNYDIKEIPIINFYDIKKNFLYEYKYNDRINEFFRLTKKINNRHIFKTYIGDKIYDIDVNYILENTVYHKFFYLQKKNNNYSNISDEIYFTIINPDNANIELIIEIRNMISINYLHRYTGVKCLIPDNILLDFVSHVAYHFKIDNIIIHSKYNSYFDIIINQLKNIDINNDLLNEFLEVGNMSNPDSNWLNLYSADNTYYSVDFIDYIYNNNKRFENKNITNIVKFYQIDKLLKLNPLDIIIENLTDPIYKIYKKYNFTSLLDLYKYIHISYPFYIKDLHYMMNIFLKKNNINIDYPITKPIYNFKPLNYLYDQKKINQITIFNYIYDDFKDKYNENINSMYRNKFRNIE